MRGKKLAGIVAGPFLAVALAVSAGASMSDHGSNVSADQHGSNKNGTEQEAKTWSKTEQANVNSPYDQGSDHGKDGHDYGKDHGKDNKDFDKKDRHESSDVDQNNEADTKAKSENENGTKQNLDQDQKILVVNRFEPKHDKPSFCHKDDSNHGHKKGWAKGHGPDCDSYGHKGDSKGHDSGSVDATQVGKNENWTDQKAKSDAKTEQANINAGYGSGKSGDVDQSNSADTEAKSSNDNWTEQNLDQNQDIWSGSGHDKGYGKSGSGDVDATQKGSNDNWTSQDADSKATTQQVNVYAPITVFSKDYRGGDVTQSNDANTTANSSNDNYTKQDLDQDQTVKSSGNGDVKAEQSGTNSNGTEQASSSTAETQQVNVYAPITVYSHGDGGGDVHQGNTADTNASSSNGNGTGQFAGQDQAAA
jgi:hypothetical protein